MSNIKLIVGLANPGIQYEGTRHNAGADFVNELARLKGAPLVSEPRFFGLTARVFIAGHDVRLLIPTTFMNRSGQSVAALANYFKLNVDEILVAHDELDLNPGVAKLKKGGGHGGHNGLRDIIVSLANSKDFIRLRVGIGHPGSAKQVANYVLARPSSDDRIAIDQSIDRTLQCIEQIVSGQLDQAMLKLHTQN